MANKRIKEIRNLTKDELVTKIRESETSLFQGRMKKVTGQLENTSSLWLMRKDLARMKMVLANQATQGGAQ